MKADAPVISIRLAGRLGAFGLDVAFDAPMRGVTALFGPSGCGKTTILRCIAGLERLPGQLAVGDAVWQDTDADIFLAPHRRHIGYVFQEASLFPHLSVQDNLLYGARRARDQITASGFDLPAIVELMGIGQLLQRSPMTLSGGERQRVAVGRAILSQPRVLLMDEPLSGLDRMSKDEILPYFEKLHETLALPILYVSHDRAEVERLADTLVLLRAGRVVRAGPLAELQTDPALPLLHAADATVVVEGRIVGIDTEFELTRVLIPGGEIQVPGRQGDVGTVRRLRIAASDVSIARTAPRDSTIINCLPARIVAIEAQGPSPQVSVLLSLGNADPSVRIVARITRKSLTKLALAAGDAVYAQIKSVALKTGH